MDQRRERRWPRVLDIRFWKSGDKDNARRAVATNISRGGLFIRTTSVVPTRTRIRVEVIHAQHGFVCEGMVVRAQRTPSHLQTVRPSGMGVRFLSPGELVEELLPHMATGERVETRATASAEAQEGVVTEAEQAPGPEAPSDSPAQEAVTPPPYRPPQKGKVTKIEGRVFEVLFRDRDRFRTVFERDIQTGGLFVPTADPAKMDEVVQVRIQVDGIGAEQIEGRVVHSMTATGPEVEGGNILAGMGIQFSDVAGTVERLRKLLG